MNQKRFIENTIHRYFFRMRKPSHRYMNYVRVFCEIYSEICRSFEENVCPFCGYKARSRKILWLHLRLHSADCMAALNLYIRRFAELYALATTRFAYYYNNNGRIKYYKCLVCNYKAKTKFEIARHILVEHMVLLEKLLTPQS